MPKHIASHRKRNAKKAKKKRKTLSEWWKGFIPTRTQKINKFIKDM